MRIITKDGKAFNVYHPTNIVPELKNGSWEISFCITLNDKRVIKTLPLSTIRWIESGVR